MSGESAPRATVAAEALERVFGPRAMCNACPASISDYRVVALFLHDTAAVRAYCRHCYPAAADGDYHAAGDGLLLDYAEFSVRFGPPGPPPPPTTAVDRLLAALIRDPALRRLSPASEAVARRRRRIPYPVLAGVMVDGLVAEARLVVSVAGEIADLSGHPGACARVRETLAGV